MKKLINALGLCLALSSGISCADDIDDVYDMVYGNSRDTYGSLLDSYKYCIEDSINWSYHEFKGRGSYNEGVLFSCRLDLDQIIPEIFHTKGLFDMRSSLSYFKKDFLNKEKALGVLFIKNQNTEEYDRAFYYIADDETDSMGDDEYLYVLASSVFTHTWLNNINFVIRNAPPSYDVGDYLPGSDEDKQTPANRNNYLRLFEKVVGTAILHSLTNSSITLVPADNFFRLQTVIKGRPRLKASFNPSDDDKAYTDLKLSFTKSVISAKTASDGTIIPEGDLTLMVSIPNEKENKEWALNVNDEHGFAQELAAAGFGYEKKLKFKGVIGGIQYPNEALIFSYLPRIIFLFEDDEGKLLGLSTRFNRVESPDLDRNGLTVVYANKVKYLNEVAEILEPKFKDVVMKHDQKIVQEMKKNGFD